MMKFEEGWNKERGREKRKSKQMNSINETSSKKKKKKKVLMNE